MGQLAEENFDRMAVVAEIRKAADEGIEENHPFWLGLEKGEFTSDQLKEWIKQEYHCRQYIIKTLYYTLANALQLTDPPQYDEDIQILLLKGVIEEYGTENFGVGDKQSHPRMLMQVGKALGLTEEEMHNCQILGCTRAWLEELIQRCDNSLIEALAGNNLTAELFNTKVFPRAIKGLKENYDFDDESLEFFYEHSDPEVEGEHVEMGARLLARYIKTKADADKARMAASFCLQGIQQWYRGLYYHMKSGATA